MDFEWDEAKRQVNLAKHGVDFELAIGFGFETAVTTEDDRHDYRERRMASLGFIGNRLYCLTFTYRGNAIRIISLRKANDREYRRYGQA